MNKPFKFNVQNDQISPIFEFTTLNDLTRHEEDTTSIFTEAVFTDGKKSIDPIVSGFKVVKDTLMTMIGENDKEKSNDKKDEKKSNKKFDPKEFWKHKCFKDLEDSIQKVFGFRAVRIQPYIEKYDSKSGDFESKELNAYTYPSDRYPIDGIVTDKGFYDKTHSIFMDIYISLGLIKALDPEEMTAVLLHEFGHNIDPVLVDIKYMEVNILSKYLTDRSKSISKNESRFIKEHKLGEEIVIFAGLLVMLLISTLPSIISWIYEKIVGKEKVEQKKLDKIKEMINRDKDKFDRKHSSEAFADNFARMYGFGAQLMSALRKVSKDIDKQIGSMIKNERARRNAILMITEHTIKDEHKTDMHRINALIKEYKEDINDPNIPKKVKDGLREDLHELELVLDMYTNDFDSFQNRVNKTIIEELQKKDDTNKTDKKGSTEEIKESVADDYYESISAQKYELLCRGEFTPKYYKLYGTVIPTMNPQEFRESGLLFHIDNDQLITESKKAYEKLMKRSETVTSSERAEFYKLFGNSKDCSLAKDKKGYYVYTHRARSDSYENIKDIPEKTVKFIRSTS